MRPNCIVMSTPGFDDDLRFATTAEPLDAQALITESAVEALIHTVLPWLPRIDQRRLNASGLEPLENRLADEFRTVVGAQIARRTVR